jgi:hypothetical protein
MRYFDISLSGSGSPVPKAGQVDGRKIDTFDHLPEPAEPANVVAYTRRR